MTQIHWLNPVSANFSTAADWTGGVVPGSADDAILDAAGSAFTVTASTSETVDSIQTATNATLSIISGTFAATKGTASGANAGAILVDPGASFLAGGTLTNTGSIGLLGASRGGQPASLVIRGSVTLEGGGTVSLSEDKSAGVIKGSGKGAVLTNVDNTISGSGTIGVSVFDTPDLALINEASGVINANSHDSGVLLFSHDLSSSNAGLMEATGGGHLIIQYTTIDNAGGMIDAVGGGLVIIGNGTIAAGGLFAGSGSVVELVNSAQIAGATITTAAGGEFEVLNSSTVATDGVIANAGSILLSLDGGGPPSLVLNNSASLTGGGTVNLAGAIRGTNTGVVLTNVDNTIIGTGEIGNGSLSLTNEAGGVIEATNSTTILTIDTGAKIITNAGLIEATGTGLGAIASAIRNSGTLEAVAGGTLTVNGAVTGGGKALINGGTLDFISSFNQNVIFSGKASVLELAQSQAYSGVLHGFSKTGGSTLDLGDVGYVSPGEATFSGTATAGVLTVTDGSHTALIKLKGDYLGATFTASSDNNGGTIVVASTTGGAHQFIAAAAALGGGAGGSMSAAHDTSHVHPPMLARPGTMIA